MTFQHAERDFPALRKELESTTGVKVVSVRPTKNKVAGYSGTDISLFPGVEVTVRLNSNGIKALSNHPRLRWLYKKLNVA